MNRAKERLSVMRLATWVLSAVVVAAAVTPPGGDPPWRGAPRSVVGIWQWRSNQGKLAGRIILVQDGAAIKGAYLESNAGVTGELEGVVEGRRVSLRRKVRWGGPGPELE